MGNSHIYYFHFLILHVYQVQDIENNHIKKLYFRTQGKYESFVRQKIKKKFFKKNLHLQAYEMILFLMNPNDSGELLLCLCIVQQFISKKMVTYGFVIISFRN